MKYLITICLALVLYSRADARWLEVGQGKAYKQIKQALAVCVDRDTILVYPGHYSEGNLAITKSVSLIGVGYPVLDGQKKFEVVSIKASHVLFAGFKVQRSGFATLTDPGGIKVYNSRFVVIRDNILDDNFFGIYLQYSKHCVIKNNKLQAYGEAEQQIGNGIHCWKSDSLQIIGNEITGHRDGIYFEFVTHSLIWKNLSEKNVRYGLHFMFSNNDAYISNEFRNNGAGVAVMFTHQVKMINNIFRENWGDAAYGLMLKEISDSHISGNKFSDNTTGIYMEGTNRITVEKNVFEGNGWGMKIQASCMDNIIKTNNFLGNTFDVSTNGSLVLNTFNSNYWDKYEGYDLDKNNVGDVPYHPLSLFSVIVEKNPPVMLLFRSFIVSLIDKSEKIMPSLTPDNFVDNTPAMKAYKL